MFEGQPQAELDALIQGNNEFKQLYQRHKQLDKQVLDAELGVLPIDDLTLTQMKREKLAAKDRLPACSTSSTTDVTRIELTCSRRERRRPPRRPSPLAVCRSLRDTGQPDRQACSRARAGAPDECRTRRDSRAPQRIIADRRNRDLRMTIHQSVLDLIGDTPMVQAQRLDTGPCELFLKLESQNPGGSIKDRIGLSMIEARREGRQDQARRHAGRRHRRQHRPRPGAGRAAEGLPADARRARTR